MEDTEEDSEELSPSLYRYLLLSVGEATTATVSFTVTIMDKVMAMERELMAEDMFTADATTDLSKRWYKL